MLSILSVDHFRNLEPLKWQPAPGSHLLLGGNGAGKTSVLEAIYVLATTRSFRAGELGDCARHGSDHFHVEAEVEDGRRTRLEVTLSAGRRTRLVNGKSASLSEHLAVLPVVAWVPAEAQALTGEPTLRRKLMDRGVVGIRPAALEVLDRYRQALRQKRRLLAGGGAEIEVWNGVLATAAADLIRQRALYVERLRAELAGVLDEAAGAGLPFPEIELRYRPSPGRGLEGAEAIAGSFERIADRERLRQLPLIGPHRDDLEVLWEGREVRRVASAGERKALSLLMVAAHGRVLAAAGRPAVHLLDDADAELAAPTLAALWGVFARAPQLFATSNRPQVWITLEVGAAWQLDKGRLEPL